VIDCSQGIREPGLLVVDSETAPWPGEYLIIGADAGANSSRIKLDGKSKTVWLFVLEERVRAAEQAPGRS
jgi:hypothetical protein